MRRTPAARPFLDTSALVKRYVLEPGSDRVRQIFDSSREIVVAPVTRLEMTSAVARRRREGRLTDGEALRILRRLEREWPDFARVRWSPDLERAARAILLRRAVRTLDAIQLASARIAGCRWLVSSDERMLDAAAGERIRAERV